jgi:hypothetical protein
MFCGTVTRQKPKFKLNPIKTNVINLELVALTRKKPKFKLNPIKTNVINLELNAQRKTF